jgi:hypothetical protein
LNEKKLERTKKKIECLEKAKAELKEKGSLDRGQIEILKTELGKYIDNVDDFMSSQIKEKPVRVRKNLDRMLLEVIQAEPSINSFQFRFISKKRLD